MLHVNMQYGKGTVTMYYTSVTQCSVVTVESVIYSAVSAAATNVNKDGITQQVKLKKFNINGTTQTTA
jgi:hypothetical protein